MTDMHQNQQHYDQMLGSKVHLSVAQDSIECLVLITTLFLYFTLRVLSRFLWTLATNFEGQELQIYQSLVDDSASLCV